MPSPNRPTLCIGVLTLNEAHQIERCLKSAQFADQVIVVDSGSTDGTVELASRMGAQVHHYPDWQGFGPQRTRLLQHVQADYVFFLDADEVISPTLRDELLDVVSKNANVVGKIRWNTFAFGKELRHFVNRSSLERFFKVDNLERYEGAVHEHAVLKIADAHRFVFRAKLDHHTRQTVKGSLEKLTQYAMLGASKRAQRGKRGGVLRGLLSSTVVFFRLYVLRLGFTGGGAGFLLCWFVALEFFFRYAALHYDRETLSGSVKR